jgi:hypothetical protein
MCPGQNTSVVKKTGRSTIAMGRMCERKPIDTRGTDPWKVSLLGTSRRRVIPRSLDASTAVRSDSGVTSLKDTHG